MVRRMSEPAAPRCARHAAPAGWQCTVCAEPLCPDCAALKVVHPATLTVCALCGELAVPLKVERVDAGALRARLKEGLSFPVSLAGAPLWVGLSLLNWVASYASLPVAFAWPLDWALTLSVCFSLVRATARGEDAPAASDFEVVSLFAPVLRFVAANLPVLLCLGAGVGWRWLLPVGLVLGALWWPVAFVAAASEARVVHLVDPRRLSTAIARIGSDYAWYVGALLGMTCLGWGAAKLLSRLPVAGLRDLLVVTVGGYVLVAASRLAGFVLKLHPQAFGGAEDEALVAALADAQPRGQLPDKARTLPAHLPSSIELPEETPVAEAQHRFAAMELGPVVAPPQALDAALLPGLGARSAESFRVALRRGDHDEALEVFRSTGLSSAAVLAVDELLWVGQLAGARGDYEVALLALQHAARREALPETQGRAWVMLGRLLGEKLQRRDEGAAWMQRVVKELPGTSAADFAGRWLSQA